MPRVKIDTVGFVIRGKPIRAGSPFDAVLEFTGPRAAEFRDRMISIFHEAETTGNRIHLFRRKGAESVLPPWESLTSIAIQDVPRPSKIARYMLTGWAFAFFGGIMLGFIIGRVL